MMLTKVNNMENYYNENVNLKQQKGQLSFREVEEELMQQALISYSRKSKKTFIWKELSGFL